MCDDDISQPRDSPVRRRKKGSGQKQGGQGGRGGREEKQKKVAGESRGQVGCGLVLLGTGHGGGPPMTEVFGTAGTQGFCSSPGLAV